MAAVILPTYAIAEVRRPLRARAPLTPAPRVIATNLVVRPSAEDASPPTGWSASAAASLTRDASWSKRGSYSARATGPVTAAAPYIVLQCGSTTLTEATVEAGKTYTASGWCNVRQLSPGGYAQFKITWRNAAGTSISETYGASTSTGVYQRILAGTAPAGAVLASVALVGVRVGTDGTVDIAMDAVTLVEGTTPRDFDGSLGGCRWTGAANLSTSELLAHQEPRPYRARLTPRARSLIRVDRDAAPIVTATNAVVNARMRSTPSGSMRGYVLSGTGYVNTQITGDGPLGLGECREVSASTPGAGASDAGFNEGYAYGHSLAGFPDTIYAAAAIKVIAYPAGATLTGARLSLNLFAGASFVGFPTVYDMVGGVTPGGWYIVAGRITRATILTSWPTADLFTLSLRARATGAAGLWTVRFGAALAAPIAAGDLDVPYGDGGLNRWRWTGAAFASASERLSVEIPQPTRVRTS